MKMRKGKRSLKCVLYTIALCALLYHARRLKHINQHVPIRILLEKATNRFEILNITEAVTKNSTTLHVDTITVEQPLWRPNLVLNKRKKYRQEEPTGKVKREPQKTILLWSHDTPVPLVGKSRFWDCPYSNCVITSDRSALNKSRAVLFNTFRLYMYVNDLPKHRFPWQDWILSTREPPYEIRKLDQYGGMFTIIMHYRRDADFNYPYSYFLPQSEISGEKIYKHAREINYNKTGLVSWIVSNCHAPSLRHKYVEELKKYIPISIYGSCGEPIDESLDYGIVISSHKFYLAFESQICPDYLTEKVWNAYKLGSVPIVLGGADYTKFLVKNSYIDVRGFSSPHSLAKYITDMDNDEYNKFFHWRQTHWIDDKSYKWCELCEHLNIHEKPIKLYDNPYGWMNKCTDPVKYYENIANITP